MIHIFHKYQTIGIQTAKGIVGGFSMTPLKREVLKCSVCEKIKYIRLDIANDAHLDNSLNWYPKLESNERQNNG